MAVIAEIEEAGKVYSMGGEDITALHASSVEVREKELLLILGPSGSGKTTLLSLFGCVIYPTVGKVYVDGIETNLLTEKEMAQIRLEKIGFVFQNFNLIAPLTAEENVAFPLTLRSQPKDLIAQKVKHALEFVKMSHRKKSKPSQLSGGEQQRIAIARALVSEPKLILCDEPTASLDSESATKIMKELRNLADQGRALAIVSHDTRLVPYAHRIIKVENGKVIKNDAKD